MFATRRTANQKVAAVHAGVQESGAQALRGVSNSEALARELNVSRGILDLWKDEGHGETTRVEAPGPNCGHAGDSGFEEDGPL